MNNFLLWAQHYGGSCSDDTEFCQSDYLTQFPQYLRGGCCMTLCCNWIAKDGDMAAFKQHINSKEGMAQVRGFQGMATKAADPASKMGGYFVGYVSEVLKIYKASFKGEIAMGDSRSSSSISELCRFVRAKDAYYQYHFKSGTDSSGHAIAFRKSGDQLAVFDPNYGMATFTGRTAGGNFNFTLTKLLRDFYPGLNGHWECMRVYRA